MLRDPEPAKRGRQKTADTTQTRPCASIGSPHAIEISFERKADSPNYRKHTEVKIGDGAAGVG
jgi:hypothetical protein